ncbi:MAG: hypothetical protein WBN96_10880 [Gammaproteobacteria bacterium]
MFRMKIGVIICGLAFLVSGCAMMDDMASCSARGGTWSEYDAIGQKMVFGRCVGADYYHDDYCDEIRRARSEGSYQTLPDYCD